MELIIEVAGDSDEHAFRLRVRDVAPSTFGGILTGQEIDLRGRPVRMRSFPTYAGLSYAITLPAGGGRLREAAFGRVGRHRRQSRQAL